MDIDQRLSDLAAGAAVDLDAFYDDQTIKAEATQAAVGKDTDLQSLFDTFTAEPHQAPNLHLPLTMSIATVMNATMLEQARPLLQIP